jgi:hypothetical protein
MKKKIIDSLYNRGNNDYFDQYLPEMVHHCKKCNVVAYNQQDIIKKVNCVHSLKGHSWNPLGRSGNQVYQCLYCGITVKTSVTPRTSGCIFNVYHYWHQVK